MNNALLIITSISFLLTTLPGYAADRIPISLDAIFGEDALDLSGAPQSGFEWLNDTTFLWPRVDADGDLIEIVNVNSRTAERTTFVDVAALEGSFDDEDQKKLRKRSTWIASPDGRSFVLLLEGDIWFYRAGRESLVRLTETTEKEKTLSWSPDGELVAFTRNNDLWVIDPNEAAERRLTTNGSDTVLNGILDWVYQEEIYGRGDYKGYWWSEDSASIAFLQLDQSAVDTFVVVDQIPYLQKVETMRYPKAGTPNALVSLHVVPASGGEISTVDPGDHEEDILVVNVSWSPDHELFFQVQNRTQTWLELRHAPRSGGDSEMLLRESSPAWVDVLSAPQFLRDGSFLWESERDGWRHVYHYAKDGSLIRQVTRGEWEVRELHGIARDHWIYFSATERSPIGLDVYRVRLDGTRLERLSERRGWHDATFNDDLSRYLDVWSNLTTPPQVFLHDNEGSELLVIDHNPAPDLAAVELAPVKLLRIQDADGFEMESMLIEPTSIEDGKRYPVYQYIYGGPHAPRVADRWSPGSGTQRHFFHQFLAQNGIGVWIVDNRTASGKGAIATRDVYRRFGETEMEDINDGMKWLHSLDWVDPERIMISGWSYGGFMTLYAMTHSEHYAAGIAGGPVTDWRDYDTIYTERFMGLPSDNQQAYETSSPRFAADAMHGTVLLIHGTIDDNVHMQNTMQMALALQKAGKDFEMMLYPESRHSISDDALKAHLYQTMWRFIRQELLEEECGVGE